MTASSLMSTYLGVGTHAARPATPNVLSGVTAVYYETDTTNTFIWSGVAWVQVNGGGGGTGYILIQDQKTQGTDGGSFNTGAWQTRDLNTIVSDTTGLVTLSSNHFVLPAGTYRARISAPAFLVSRHQIRLQNTTDAATVLTGTSEYCQASGGGYPVQSRSFISGRFTIGASKNLEVQHQCTSSQATNGFGVDGNFGTEIYTTVELEKE